MMVYEAIDREPPGSEDDPVLKLADALIALGVKPDGYCWCATHLQAGLGHTGECLQALKALQLVHRDARTSKFARLPPARSYKEDPTHEPI